MWKSLSEVFDSVSQKVQQKVNGEETTAEYYNPIGQDESQFSRFGNNENYVFGGVFLKENFITFFQHIFCTYVFQLKTNYKWK